MSYEDQYDEFETKVKTKFAIWKAEFIAGLKSAWNKASVVVMAAVSGGAAYYLSLPVEQQQLLMSLSPWLVKNAPWIAFGAGVIARALPAGTFASMLGIGKKPE